jgi:Spy/CpxP family protein refolding chaperone
MRRSKNIMKLWIRKTVMSGSMTGALALLVGGIAMAQQAPALDTKHHHGHHAGLVGQALKLDSLTLEQRAGVKELVVERRSARTPVRQADARVLSQLAQEVEQASIDAQALAPSLNAENTAAVAESAAEKDTLNRLHALLTPAQRNQLVDRVESEHARAHEGPRAGHGRGEGWGQKLGLTPEQKSQIATNLRAERPASAPGGEEHARRPDQEQESRSALEAFRGDSFTPDALVHVERGGERAEILARAMVPVLTPAQRKALADSLRQRAAHKVRS